MFLGNAKLAYRTELELAPGHQCADHQQHNSYLGIGRIRCEAEPRRAQEDANLVLSNGGSRTGADTTSLNHEGSANCQRRTAE